MLHRSRFLVLLALLSAVAAGACDSDDDGTDPQLTAPGNVTVTATGPRSAQVTFTTVAGATAYRVERAAGSSGGSFALLGTTTTTTFNDTTGLQPNSPYRYRVAASAGSLSSPFSVEAVITTPAEGPKTAVLAADIETNRTLYADTLYTLRGFIHVRPGATLTIEPGTVIQGDFNTLGSSLFVLRGAKIMANGTADAPIVFTSSQPAGQRKPGDWGGLIILGNGVVNRTSPVLLEGTGTSAANPEINYAGGTDNNDDSGVLRYVRIEFAGFGPVPDAELNALTLAAVGAGTEIEYVQTLAGLDDSFEWFGGAVDARYLVSYEAGDDHFDASEGYQGRNQHLIAFQSKVLQPRTGAGNVSGDPQGFEVDGCAGSSCPQGERSTPYNLPVFANFTMIGTGSTQLSGSSGGHGMVLRRGTGGHWVNGVVARWPRSAMSIRDASTSERLTAGELSVANVLVAEVPVMFETGSSRFSVDSTANAIRTAPGAAASLFTLLPTVPTNGAQFDWTPPAASAATTGGAATFSGQLAARAGTFVTGTSYVGAVNPAGPKWWQGWTNYAEN